MKTIRCILLLGTLNLWLPPCVYSQSDTDHQYWFDYSPRKRVSEKIVLDGSIGNRFISPNLWQRFYVKTRIRYEMGRLFFKGATYYEALEGGVNFYTTNNTNYSNSMEIRPYQGYHLIWPNTERFKINSRFMLEERIEIYTEDWSRTFGMRVRYSGEPQYNFKSEKSPFFNSLYAVLRLDVFVNLIKTDLFNDNLRLTPGLGYVFDDTWQVALYFGYQYTRYSKNDSFEPNNTLLRLRVYHNLD